MSRFRPTDAFVDESIRGQRYLMGCVLIEARYLADVRPAIAALGVAGTRVHFNNESTRQRTRVLTAIAHMPIRAFVTVCQISHGVTSSWHGHAASSALSMSCRAGRSAASSSRAGRTTARTRG